VSPHVMDPEEFSRVLKGYTHTVLVQYPICSEPEKIREYIKGRSLEALRAESDYPLTTRKGLIDFMDFISRLERDSMNMGHRFSAGL